MKVFHTNVESKLALSGRIHVLDHGKYPLIFPPLEDALMIRALTALKKKADDIMHEESLSPFWIIQFEAVTCYTDKPACICCHNVKIRNIM